MPVLIALCVFALLALSAWLLCMVTRLKAQVAALHARLHSAPALPPAVARGPYIAITILNPFELAAREHRFAPTVARLAPKLIERIVYEKAAVMITQQMAEQGVQAEVQARVA